MTHIAVIIPCYNVRSHIIELLSRIGPEVTSIFVIDDCCPQGTGKAVSESCRDTRVKVIRHQFNQGVGGAMITGYRAALEAGAEVVVKIDGDGQMDPAYLPTLVEPLLGGEADYSKGNRFFSLDFLAEMPAVRVFGNAVLSFVNKAASGYWNLMDPNNGYVAIHARTLAMLPLDKIDKRYFFESDMLFRLNTIRAVVTEIPMKACYAGEKSNLKISRILLDFPPKYGVRLGKRILYNYFLRDFNVCSLQLVSGLALSLFGTGFGAYRWYLSSSGETVATTGTVMLAALPIILGFQLLLSALSFDTQNIPREALHPRLPRNPAAGKYLEP